MNAHHLAPSRLVGLPVPLLVALALAAVAGLGGVLALGNWSVTRGPEELTQTFATPDGRVQLRGPRSWSARPADEGALFVASASGDACVTVFSEDKVILGQQMTHGEYGRVAVESLKRRLDGPASVAGPVPLSVNGRPALRYAVAGRADGTPTTFVLTVVEGECRFHQILARTTARDRCATQALLERIAATFCEMH